MQKMKAYWILSNGDIIRDGDEILKSDYKWYKVSDRLKGTSLDDHILIIRRKYRKRNK